MDNLKGSIKAFNVYHTDAYMIAVRNGFEGTEAEWLESLKGEPGYTPKKGIDYFDGEKGDPGDSQLPEVTDADNGKILQVVNGALVLVTMKESEVKTYIDEYISSALEGEY